MDEQKSEPIPAMTPEEMEARIERLQGEGRMPSVEQFLDVMAAGWEEYVRSLEAETAIPPNGEPQPVLGPAAPVKRTKPIPIDAIQRVSDERRGDVAAEKQVRRDANRPGIGPREDGRSEGCDLTVGSEDNIITFAAHSEGTRFLNEDLQTEPWQWIGEVLWLDRSQAKAVLDGAENKGMRVRFLTAP